MGEKIIDFDFDWNGNYEDEEAVTVCADSAADGLLKSLDDKGCVDVAYIAAVCGKDPDTVIHELSGSIYRNPANWDGDKLTNWETSDEYLSGNIAAKLRIAKEQNLVFFGEFNENIRALSALIGPGVSGDDIYFCIGSPWLPAFLFDEFMLHLIGEEKVNGKYRTATFEAFLKRPFCVRHDDITGTWEIPHKSRFDWLTYGKYRNVLYNVYGTNRMSMVHLLEATLNMRTPNVTDEVTDFRTGKPKRVSNKEETMKLVDRQELLQREFRNWIRVSKERSAIVRNAYNAKYGNIIRRVFNGAFLSFPTMSPAVTLYPYQKDAVARILLSKNTLLAHSVGAGKTYEMIAAGQELMRTGRSAKNLYVVPNNVVGQWRDIFLTMYPDAKLLVVTNANFNIHRQTATLVEIRDGKYDGIIMASSCFDRISLSKRYLLEDCDEKLYRLDEAGANLQYEGRLDRKKRAVRYEKDKILADPKLNNNGLNFDDLGITFFALDEAHLYKNAGVDTAMTNVLGLGGKCAKSASMMEKVHYVQKSGGRVVFATGTPITNSLCDIFVLQKYLQNDELEMLGLSEFDSWAGMFADKSTGFEIDVDTNSYHMVTRFSRFCNVPELAKIFSSVADFHPAETERGMPRFEGYDISEGEGSEELTEYLKEISRRADDVRSGKVPRDEDNLLKITIGGKMVALDVRLVNESAKDYPESKVNRCADNIAEIYFETRDKKYAQIVFCDSSTPKDGFNMYDELKRKLVERGLPAECIAFVHDSCTDSARNRLFAAVNKGDVAVIIGSTAKLGFGVNVQERLCALHHLDVCWKASDMVQREGRILRPGNKCERVRIFRYITKGSFDAYSWQLLENKQRFTEQILQGCAEEREGSDVDCTSLSYAEVKALAVGNPLMKKRVETQTVLDKYRMLQRAYIEDRHRKTAELGLLPSQIAEQEDTIARAERDFAEIRPLVPELDDLSDEGKKELASKIWSAVNSCINLDDDTYVSSIAGFDIIVPAHMAPKVKRREDSEEQDSNTHYAIPYICLCRNGRYYLDVETEKGIIARLSHFLSPYKVAVRRKDNSIPPEEKTAPSGLEARLNGCRERLLTLQTRESVLRDELSRDGGYIPIIESAQTLLAQIDEQLEVKAS